MPSPEVNLRILAEHSDDENAQPSCTLDSSVDLATPLQLAGFKVHSMGTIIVAPTDVDVPLAFTGAVALYLLSEEKFSMRLAAAESLLAGIRAFVVHGDEAATAAHTTSVLLTGNTTNEAAIKYWIYEAI